MQCDAERHVGIVRRRWRYRLRDGLDRSQLLVDFEFERELDFDKRMAGGQGDGSVSYSVAANAVPASRYGSLVVASATVSLTQAAASCAFTLSRTHAAVPAAGGVSTVGVSTISGCAWSAGAIDSWVTVTAGQNGNASGTVTLSIAGNAGAARTGQAVIAGQRYTLVQAGIPDPPNPPAPTPPSPSPPPPPLPPVTVHLDGVVSALTGRCPNLQFTVAGAAVVTNPSTDFHKKGSCEDLSNGDGVKVDGVRQGGVVLAQAIQIDHKKKDD